MDKLERENCLKRNIQEIIKKRIDEYGSQEGVLRITKGTLKNIKEIISKELSKINIIDFDVKQDKEDDSKINIIPKNNFTKELFGRIK